VGITLVPGNLWPLPGAEAMYRILDIMKRSSIPVALGAQMPLVHTRAMAEIENQRWGPIDYLGALGVDPAEASKKVNRSGVRRASHRNGVEFIIDTIENASVPVTILAIGPMTNIAMALRLRPDLEKKIHRLVFMGGAVHVKAPEDKRAAEFNFWFDPEAARIVLRSAIEHKTMFGLDICNQAKLDKAHYEQIAREKTAITSMYRQDIGKRLDKADSFTYLWDCLAAGYLIDPAFVTKRETAYLDVDTAFGPNYGAVVPLERALAPEATPVEVMLDLDFEKFFEMYKRLLTRPPGL